MEEMKIQPEEQEIDLVEVFCVLWHRAWFLLLSLVAGVVLVGAVTYLTEVVKSSSGTLVTPLYRATSTICAFSANTDAEYFLMELELSNSLAADLRFLGTTHEVVETALEVCGIERPYKDVVGSIGVYTPSNSHMLTISVTDVDPELAAQLCNALADQLKLKVAEVMGIDVPVTASRASVPTDPINAPQPTNPIPENLMRNCILGGVVFFVLAAGAVLLVHFVGDGFKKKMAVIRNK